MYLDEVKAFLRRIRYDLADQISQRIYSELDSYQKGPMPREESRFTLMKLLDFIIFNLAREEEIAPDNQDFMKEVVCFEQGIASRRARYQIKLVDILHALRMFRNDLWRALEKEFSAKITAPELFDLEKRVNKFCICHMISVSGQYLRLQEQVIEDQAKALKSWEEVVKSASRIDLKIPCRSEFALIARMQAEAIARRVGYPEEEVQDIKTAVGEACDNAIEHGSSSQGILINYQLSMEDLRVEVLDFGKGFKSDGIGDQLPAPLAERGRGIYLMKRFMDRVEIVSAPGRGTRVVLSKKRIFK